MIRSAPGSNMSFFKNFTFFAVLTVLAAICIPVVNAFYGGDAAALIIGLLIALLGFFACLGYYARKKGSV